MKAEIRETTDANGDAFVSLSELLEAVLVVIGATIVAENAPATPVGALVPTLLANVASHTCLTLQL